MKYTVLVEELYARFHIDEAILDYLCNKDVLTPEEEDIKVQLLIQEEAEYGYDYYED